MDQVKNASMRSTKAAGVSYPPGIMMNDRAKVGTESRSAGLMSSRFGMIGLAAMAYVVNLICVPTASGAQEFHSEQGIASTTLSFNLSNALAQESKPDTAKPDPSESERSTDYGLAGSRWWTVGLAWANNFESSNDVNIHGAWSTFLADDFEFAVEGAVWYFNQPGSDTGGISGSMIFRWHFWHPDENRNWTVFADAGIGLLAAFDNVPEGGTSFNFLPRLGMGFTKALTDSDSGPRFMAGVRWHHISNARIGSDSSNPARDALCGYASIVFPF